jgi:repressor of nif and glnA expression
MDIDAQRKVATILNVLAEVGAPLGSTRIARELTMRGVDLKERMVRYYLELMDEQGFTENLGRAGRRLTPHGRREAEQGVAVDRVGFVSSRVDELAFRQTLDLESMTGDVILNVTMIPQRELSRASKIVKSVVDAELGMGELIAVSGNGTRLAGAEIPKGSVAIGTICSVTLNGVLRAYGIPVAARFGGLLELRDGRPVRFSQIIYYDGTTIDPIEIFIRGRMTHVGEAARTGTGVIGAGFREIPAVALPKTLEVLDKLKRLGLGGAMMVGAPGKALLDVPVSQGRVGLVLAAGLNPMAAVAEAGIETVNRAMAVLSDVGALSSAMGD